MDTSTPLIREATHQDIESITSIYNDAILNTNAVYREEPTTIEERMNWMLEKEQSDLPILVAIIDNQIAGFASYGPFRPWPGFRYTAEHMVYTHPQYRGRGVGKTLISALIEKAKHQHLKILIGGIDASNETSIRLHEKLGFKKTGHLYQVGFKFGKTLDLVFMQLTL